MYVLNFWRFLSTLLHLMDAWYLKFKLLSSQAPRYLTISDFFMFSPQTLISVEVIFFSWWLVPNIMNSVLLALILTWLLPIHSSMLFIVASNIFMVSSSFFLHGTTDFWREWSSAKASMAISDRITLSIVLEYDVNKYGDRNLSCVPRSYMLQFQSNHFLYIPCIFNFPSMT